MTVDNTQPPETTTAVDEGFDTPEPAAAAKGAAAPFLTVSLGFFVLALLTGLAAATQLVVPDLFAGTDVLVYGKLLPIATNLFLYGWLTIGLAGALVYVVVRSGGGTVAAGPLKGAVGLMALGVLAGTVGIALGFSEGRLYLEYPLWADALILLGFLGVARAVFGAVTTATRDSGPVRWYAQAAVTWFILTFIVGNIPGLGGIASAYQSSFFRASFYGLWLGAAGLAVVYAVLPRIAGRSSFAPTRLTQLGFWSLAFIWPLAAPANLTFGPAPDWLATVGVTFSLGLLIPGGLIATDLVLALRQRWTTISGDMSARFLLLGTVIFAVWPLLNLMVAFRASNNVVQFTDWITATEHAAFFGAFTAWLIGYVAFAAPHITGKGLRPGLSRIHYFGTVLGLITWVGAALVAGTQAGWTWIGAANEETVSAVGPGWINTIRAVEGIEVVVLAGFAVFVLAQLVFIFNLAGSGPVQQRPFVALDDDPNDELILRTALPASRLRAGVVGLFVLAAFLVWGVPTLETAGAEATMRADVSRTYASGSLESEGREIYLSQGCWYCHTQEVRVNVTDVGLGPVTVPGDLVYETPVLLGTQRVGPDLMHVGSRIDTSDPAWVVAHLVDPRSQRPHSTMPSYGHLSNSELDALAAYIVGLK